MPITSSERYKVEADEGWREIIDRIPFIAFPKSWKVSVIPPFSGAVARFRVKLPTGVMKSVYLDWFDTLGCVGEPYWEVHPVDGDCGRCLLNEIPELLKLIKAKS